MWDTEKYFPIEYYSNLQLRHTQKITNIYGNN